MMKIGSYIKNIIENNNIEGVADSKKIPLTAEKFIDKETINNTDLVKLIKAMSKIEARLNNYMIEVDELNYGLENIWLYKGEVIYSYREEDKTFGVKDYIKEIIFSGKIDSKNSDNLKIFDLIKVSKLEDSNSFTCIYNKLDFCEASKGNEGLLDLHNISLDLENLEYNNMEQVNTSKSIVTVDTNEENNINDNNKKNFFVTCFRNIFKDRTIKESNIRGLNIDFSIPNKKK